MLTEKFVLGPIQQAWIKSLREHPERQMSGMLGERFPSRKDGNFNYKACCLGEGGLIAGVCVWGGDGNLRTNTHLECVATLGSDTYKALGLNDQVGGSSDPNLNSLAALNDSDKTWLEIADILEQNSEKYFTHSI